MVHLNKDITTAQRKHSSDIEQCLDNYKQKFNQILFGVFNEGNQDAHKVEASIFKQLMKLGFRARKKIEYHCESVVSG